MKLALQRIIDWTTGEAYFAIVRGEQILKPLRHCHNWTDACAEYRTFVA